MKKQQVKNNGACDLFIVRYSTALSETMATHVAYLTALKIYKNNGIAHRKLNQYKPI